MKNQIKKLIRYRDYYYNRFLRFFINVFNVFPVKNNRIFFYSFNGKQYSDNPRVISEALLLDKEDFEIVWAFNKPQNYRSILPQSFKSVRYGSLLCCYYAKTSKVQVFNSRSDGRIARRNNQIYIQTWHASNGYKKLNPSKGVDSLQNKLTCADYSYVMCGSSMMEKERARGTMNFSGPIIKGTPRMDSIIKGVPDYYKKLICDYYKLPLDLRIALYAPTYRSRKESDYGLDYKNIVEQLKLKYGGSWILLVRLHYFVEKRISSSPDYIDATSYPDIQDLLMASDVLISDYSSCIWDFSFLNRPCFLFCPDLRQYSSSVNFNIPIKDWGFPIATTMEELRNNIECFDSKEYNARIIKHHNDMGSYEDGCATKRVCDIIKNFIKA